MTGCSWRRRAASCPAHAGARSSSPRPRCSVGIGVWWRDDGRRHVVPAGRRFVRKFGSWSCGSREKTRAGDINASLGSSKDSASRCRRRPCAHGFGKVASDRSALARARPGANSYERIGKVCSPSISSPWRRSGCNGSTCSSSSSWAVVVCISPDARPIKRAVGDAAGPAIDVDFRGAPGTSPLPDSRSGSKILREF